MKKKKLIIYDSEGKPANEYDVPRFVNEGDVNKWAVRMFAGFRKNAENKGRVDSWDLRSEEE